MARIDPLTVYRNRLSARMKALRGRRFTQKQVADSLLVELDAYKKWEQRGALPLDYVERFANLVGESISFVVTGRREDFAEPPDVPAKVLRKRLRA